MLYSFYDLVTKRWQLGEGEVRYCPRCLDKTQWSRVRDCRQFTLFSVPVARWQRRTFEVCDKCDAAVFP